MDLFNVDGVQKHAIFFLFLGSENSSPDTNSRVYACMGGRNWRMRIMCGVGLGLLCSSATMSTAGMQNLALLVPHAQFLKYIYTHGSTPSHNNIKCIPSTATPPVAAFSSSFSFGRTTTSQVRSWPVWSMNLASCIASHFLLCDGAVWSVTLGQCAILAGMS